MNRGHAAVRLDEKRQTKKQQEVLNVASDYFLSHGYQGASVNAMARDSGISKESIYRYYSSKKALFLAVIAKELRAYRERLDFLDMEHESLPLADVLARTGESIMQAVTSDRVLGFRRLVFQEAAHSPEIGQLYYEIGPQAAYTYLEKIFSEYEGETRFEPEVLANYFVAMILHRFMLWRECGVADAPDRDEVSRHVVEVTDHFLTIYFRNSESAGS